MPPRHRATEASTQPILRLLGCLLLLNAGGGWVLAQGGAATPAAGPVLVLELDGVIGPAAADFVQRGLARAQRSGARLVVLQLDTPGGLDTSMRLIIKDILASPVPVAAFVAPEGARAASAGTFIVYASHVAAMAPATNLGAATPVSIGGGSTPAPEAKDSRQSGGGDAMTHKAVNDAVAYLRSLAQLRGRNAEFAEQAVREARSLPAAEAREHGVIDVIAADVPALLRAIDGRTVRLATGSVRLQLTGAPVERLVPDWRNRLLALISNPTLAVVLLMIGIYGLFVEFTTPGVVVPGVAGAIALLLGLYALQLLPTNWAGLALLLLGASLMIAEAFLPSFGVIGVGGIVAFVVGGMMLFDTEAPGFGVPLAWLIGIALAGAVLIMGVGTLALRARRRPVVSGREELVGTLGTVESVEGTHLWVRVHGELWQARMADAGAPPAAGMAIRVQSLDGLQLEVVPAPSTRPLSAL